MKDNDELQKISCNGFTWAYTEEGAYFFSKKIPGKRERIDATTERIIEEKYALMRVLPADLENGNFEYFCEHGLTNNNKA